MRNFAEFHGIFTEIRGINEVWLTLPLNADGSVTKSREHVTNDTGNVTDDPKNVTNSPNNVTNDTKNVTNSPINGSKTDKRRDSVLEILKSDCAVTTEEIAVKLNVSKRTILRDLEFLSKSSIIKREGGSFGGKWIVNK